MSDIKSVATWGGEALSKLEQETRDAKPTPEPEQAKLSPAAKLLAETFHSEAQLTGKCHASIVPPTM